MKEFETFQTIGPEGVEGPTGENLQSPGGHTPPASVRSCPIAHFRRGFAGRDVLEDYAADQLSVS